MRLLFCNVRVGSYGTSLAGRNVRCPDAIGCIADYLYSIRVLSILTRTGASPSAIDALRKARPPLRLAVTEQAGFAERTIRKIRPGVASDLNGLLLS
jgi:hypothetical protein